VSPRATRAPSVMEVALRRAGFRKGWTACLYLAQWGIASDAKGRLLNATEVGVWWAEPRATTYRHEATFKAAFPDEGNPARLWALCKVPGPLVREDLPRIVPVVVSARWAVAA